MIVLRGVLVHATETNAGANDRPAWLTDHSRQAPHAARCPSYRHAGAGPRPPSALNVSGTVVSIPTPPFAKFPKKNFSSPKNSVLSLPSMFDRVSSDKLKYGGHAECLASASRYTNGRGRQLDLCAAPPPSSANFVQESKAIYVESIGPSAATCCHGECLLVSVKLARGSTQANGRVCEGF
jgi:hypothetical protein